MSEYADEYEDQWKEDFYDEDDDSLEHAAWHVAEWWLEDYSFDELLEEFDVVPEAAFVAIVLAGLVDEDVLVDYLASDR